MNASYGVCVMRSNEKALSTKIFSDLERLKALSENFDLARTVPRPLNHLADEITELCGHLNAANYRWLSLIAEFDRRKGWSDWATQSCAHWLNWRRGLAMNAALEKVRVARALEDLPKISEAMSKGQTLRQRRIRGLGWSQRLYGL